MPDGYDIPTGKFKVEVFQSRNSHYPSEKDLLIMVKDLRANSIEEAIKITEEYLQIEMIIDEGWCLAKATPYVLDRSYRPAWLNGEEE